MDTTDEPAAAPIPLTQQQIQEAFEALVGIPPRLADILVVLQLGGNSWALADLIWDHFMGEPEEPSLVQVHQQVLALAAQAGQEP
jgi:hypothetical protein